MIDEFDLDQDGESMYKLNLCGFRRLLTDTVVNEQEFIAICTEH